MKIKSSHYLFSMLFSLLLSSCSNDSVTPSSSGAKAVSCQVGYELQGKSCKRLPIVDFDIGYYTAYALFENGDLQEWWKTSKLSSAFPVKVDLGKTDGVDNKAQAVSAGAYHRCVILKNESLDHGPLKCWGSNNHEQLGVGDSVDKTLPTPVTALGTNTAKSVVIGKYHTCTLLDNDKVKCWGKNSYGQIGGGSGADKIIIGTAGDPLLGKTATEIAAGGEHSCAVLTNKSVQCWGWDFHGQSGSGGIPSLGGERTALKLALGNEHSCAVLDDHSIKCWGGDNNGQIQGGSPDLGEKTASSIVAGSYYNCTILSDKTVKCWGIDNGQIGGGTTSSIIKLSGTSGDPLLGKTVKKIAAGVGYNCVLLEADDSIRCWGIMYGIPMKQGSNGTGQGRGESPILTVNATPSATELETDMNGKVCKITLSDLDTPSSSPWTIKDYTTTPLTYNSTGNTIISKAIDNLISTVGATHTWAGAKVTLSRKESNTIEASVDIPAFTGMSLNILHEDDGGDCSSPVTLSISLSGGPGGTASTGLWAVSQDFNGSAANNSIKIDGIEITLGASMLTQKGIVDLVVNTVNNDSWGGVQYKELPYKATKVQNSDNSDCPSGDFCVLFTRIFKSLVGNSGLPFQDITYAN